jgi:integrase
MDALVARWKQKYAAYTVVAYRGALIKLLRHIEMITRTPGLRELVPRVRPGKPRRVIATPEEINRLTEHAPRWLHCAILLAAHAGLRRTDITRIAPEHYDPQKRTLTIEQQKTGHPVTLPVSDALAQMLDYLTNPPPATPYLELFHERPTSPMNLTQAWIALRKKAAVNPNLTLHDLRRTLAVSLYEVSKDLRVVEQMLGHQSLRATIHYLEHRDPEKLKPYLQQIWTPATKVIQ